MSKTHVAIILDRSTSMGTIRKETIQAFNEQVKTIRESSRGQNTTVSLFTFSTVPDEPTFFAAPVENLKELAWDDYVPNGWTALNDSVLMTTSRLSELPDAAEADTAFLVIIISDGDENKSLHSPEEVRTRLEALQASQRWTFTYVGCSEQDLLRMRDLGITRGNSRLFTADACGVASSSALNCSATSSYFEARSAGSTQVNNLYDQAESSLGVSQPNPPAGGVVGSVGGMFGVTFDPSVGGNFFSIPAASLYYDCGKFVGLTESEANGVAAGDGKYLGIVKRDGIDQVIPAFCDMNRVCVSIDQGKVTDARLG